MSVPGHHAPHRRMQRKRVALGDELVQRRSLVPRAPPGDILGGDATSSNNPVPTRSSAAPTDGHGSPNLSPTTAQTSSSQQSSSTSSATRPTTSSTPSSTKGGDDTPTGIVVNIGTSSTSSSTGTSTSTSSSSTSTSLTSTVVTTTGINGPVVVTTVRGPHTSFITPTLSSTATPSATNTAAPLDEGSSINVGGIVGGVVATLLGVAILSAIIRWLSRRSKRRDNDNSDNFDPNEFRRSGVMLNDSLAHSEPIDRGYNPRPPTMIERRFPGAPGPSFGAQYGGNGPPGQIYGDPTGMQSHYPPYPPQAQIMNVAQPSYPDTNSYASPISLIPASLPPRAPSALDNPYDNPASFDGHAQVSSNPYMAPQAAFAGSEFAVRQSIDYVTLNHSGPPTPVTASPFESPSFFAPVAADAEPLYAASQSKSRQNSLEPPTTLAAVAAAEMPTRASSDFHGRPSEDYTRTALPVHENSTDAYGVPAAKRQNTFPHDSTRPDTVYAL